MLTLRYFHYPSSLINHLSKLGIHSTRKAKQEHKKPVFQFMKRISIKPFRFLLPRDSSENLILVIPNRIICVNITNLDKFVHENRLLTCLRTFSIYLGNYQSTEDIMVRHTYHREEDSRNTDYCKRQDKSRKAKNSKRGGVWHEHKCKWCGVYYAHLHPMRYHDHPQFKYQCPNKHCEAYHRGKNETRAYVVEKQKNKK